jgi:tyrosinase
VKHKTASATIEGSRMAQTSTEPMVSFADMLRLLDPELMKIVKIPPHWFPKVHERKDQGKLTKPERERFLCAYLTLVGNGTLGQFVKIHAETHYQHMSERFLPWHRVYLLLLEHALESVHPDVTIPYWDWTKVAEQTFPAWLAPVTPTVPMPPPTSPITVTRSPGQAAWLAMIASGTPGVMASGAFSPFTGGLEGIHNGVHVWVGGTMSWIATAPADPIFWMHHANIDRLWSVWQAAHPGLNPNLPGPPSSAMSPVMDPWSYTEPNTRSISAMG